MMKLAHAVWFLGFLGASLPCAAQPTTLTTERVASGLTLPVFVTHAPGDPTRLFIVEQHEGGTNGVIKILDLVSGTVLPDPFLIVPDVTISGEQGLLGLAFHPQYQSNGFFYVDYTAPGGGNAGHTVVERYKVSADPNIGDPDSKSAVINIDQPYENHNGGWIGFGPDGYLYIAMGDGGAGNDPQNNAQTITNDILGKMLRLDVNGDDFPADNQRNYRIPADNPFVGTVGDDEIWAYGLRNPWRDSFDRQTGDLWIADVGEGSWEEVDFQPAGLGAGGRNYGWHCMEAAECHLLGGCDCQGPLGVPPIHFYSHSEGCAIVGGYVYRGAAMPGLHGTYFFSDLCSARIWAMKYDGTAVTYFADRTDEMRPGNGLAISWVSSFGEDAEGELYIVDYVEGEVFKIVPGSPGPDCNNNGVLDSDDIAAGTSLDVNGNGIPDECECIADFNGDGFLDGLDYDAFTLAFETGLTGDFNGDGFIDGLDYDQFFLAFEAGDLAADVNHDGFVDGIDADVFTHAFESGLRSADINRDGFVDGVDYDAFMNAFERGC